MKNFDGLGLSPTLSKSLAVMKYDTPTPIQAQAIPPALEGRDIMGSAQTGTGKTAAYAIPAVEHLLKNEQSSALVLTPTRELGKQVMEIMAQMLGSKSKIKTAFIIGGEPYRKQLAQLEKRPRLIVGTPGRINDHLERGSLELDKADFLILDETDRMLDMGFSVQLDRIFKYLPKKRQTLMFSATLPNDIVKLSKKYLDNPERVAVGSTIKAAPNIRQEVIKIDDDKKYEELLNQLHTRTGSVIMFVKTKYATERMAKRLRADGYQAQAIHGDLKQTKREKVIQAFRVETFRILVATDVVARGLDIPHIQHVVNYDLPQVPEDFIHRIGRTARAGADGEALSFVSPKEGRKWYAIELLLNPDAKPSSRADNEGGRRRPNKNKSRGGSKRGDKKPEGKFGKKSFDKKPYAKKSRKPDDRAGNKFDKKSSDKSDDSFDKSAKGKKRKPNKRKDFYEAKKQGQPSEKSDDKRGKDAKKSNNKKPYAKKSDFKKGEGKGKSFKSAGKDGAKPKRGNSKPSTKKPFGKPAGKTTGKPSGKSSGGNKPLSKKRN